MLKKIFRTSSFILFAFLIASSTLFSSISPAKAAQMGSNTSEDNSLDIMSKESSDSIGGQNTSSVPDLGDDQAFPFIPGFGKNSGKD